MMRRLVLVILLLPIVSCSSTPSQSLCDLAADYLVGDHSGQKTFRVVLRDIVGAPDFPLPKKDQPFYTWLASYEKNKQIIVLDRPPYHKAILFCDSEHGYLRTKQYIAYAQPPFSDRELETVGVYAPLSLFNGERVSPWLLQLIDVHTGAIHIRECKSYKSMLPPSSAHAFRDALIIHCHERSHNQDEFLRGVYTQEWYARGIGLVEMRLASINGDVILDRAELAAPNSRAGRSQP